MLVSGSVTNGYQTKHFFLEWKLGVHRRPVQKSVSKVFSDIIHLIIVKKSVVLGELK